MVTTEIHYTLLRNGDGHNQAQIHNLSFLHCDLHFLQRFNKHKAITRQLLSLDCLVCQHLLSIL